MADYITFSLPQDAGELEEIIYTAIQDEFPDWTPRRGHLTTLISEVVAQIDEEILTLAADVPAAIFRFFGPLIGVSPTSAVASSTTSTWSFSSNPLGRTIPAGTQVRFTEDDANIAFEVAADVVTASPATSTAAGAVTLRALDGGEFANGLADAPELLDDLEFVTNIALVAPTTGGVDEELDDDYLDRLSKRLTLLAFRPILEDDVTAFIQTTITGVGRVAVFDNYDSLTDTDGVERTVSFAGIDTLGAILSGPKKTEILAALQATRETNFVFRAFDPTLNTIGVTTQVRVHKGWEQADVEAAVAEVLNSYLAAINWGAPPSGETLEWITDGADKVRYGEVWSVIDQVEGVNYLQTLQIKLGAGALGVIDLTLAGKAPLTTPGVITVTSTVPA